jgi:dipeptidyl aminopeptidase/acylaminoacyl peptidase
MDSPVKLWLIMFFALASVAHASEQLPAQAYGRLPAFFDAAISPDGKHLALGRNDDSGEQFLQIINLATGKTVAGIKHRPTAREQDKAVIREVGWADNRRATYLLSATLPTMRMVPDGVITPGRSHIDLWRTSLLDIQSGKTYLVKRAEKYDWGLVFSELRAPIAGDASSGRMIIRSSPYRDGVVNVYRVDLDNGRTRTLTKGNTRTRTFLLDGGAEPRVRLDVDERTNQWRIFMLDRGEDRLLSSGVSPTGGIGIAGLTSFGEVAFVDLPNDQATDVLYTLHPESGALTVLAEHPRYDVDAALFDPWTGTVVGARITEELPTHRFFDVELGNVVAAIKKKLPGAYVELHTWSADRKQFIAFIERPGDAGGYYMYSAPTEDLRLVGLTYSELKARDLGVRQEIEFKARDGTAIPAYLTMPDDNLQEKRPLVALVHGGPTARDTLAFDWWASFLASRGYAVIQPNYRGSSGYGRAWQEAGYRQWGSLMQDDVEDAVHALVRAGVADPSRICIVGASYGGYAALVGGTRDPDLYRCVASIAGVADLPMMLVNETVQMGKDSAAVDWWTMLMGNRRDDRNQLEAVSPAYQAANVKAPVLLIHGELDTVVPIKQSERMANALKSAGKAVKFVRLYGEDHWLSDAETRIRMLEELEMFLAEHLR